MSAPLLTLGFLLIATFAFGGSARGDELGVILLRPISVIALLISLYWIKPEHIRNHRFWTFWLLSIVALTLLHLIPLPPSIWHMLPGRDLAIEADRLIGTPDAWRPISLSPELTRNALWSMVAPLACFLLMIQLSRRDMTRALIIIVVLGAVSGMLSVIQISQGPGSIAYLYRITNFGLGVGLFANRNHQAVLLVCLIPISLGLAMIAVKANEALTRGVAPAMVQWGLALAAVFIFILVMVTGSRTGLALYVLAMAATLIFARRKAAFLFKRADAPKRRAKAGRQMPDLRYALLILPMLVVGTVFLSGRDDAFKRLTDTDSDSEARFSIVETLWGAINAYFPVGSGIGSFDPVFRAHEGSEILAPTYWNHAHNDWAELVMTGGLPALLIVAAALFWLVRFYLVDRSAKTQHTDMEAFRFMGGCVLVLTSLSSIVEYPLRVPILSCLFVMSIALLSKARLSASR